MAKEMLAGNMKITFLDFLEKLNQVFDKYSSTDLLTKLLTLTEEEECG